eukprot:Skav216253  [mRNA]  locus=scaffold20:208525:217349:+ [translate_table: standard]
MASAHLGFNSLVRYSMRSTESNFLGLTSFCVVSSTSASTLRFCRSHPPHHGPTVRVVFLDVREAILHRVRELQQRSRGAQQLVQDLRPLHTLLLATESEGIAICPGFPQLLITLPVARDNSLVHQRTKLPRSIGEDS